MMMRTVSLPLSHDLNVHKIHEASGYHNSVAGKNRVYLTRTGLSSCATRQDVWSLQLLGSLSGSIVPVSYRCNALVCPSALYPGSGNEGPILKSTAVIFTSVTGTNLILRDCAPLLGFRLVCQSNSSRGDISGDEENLEFVGSCFLELWVLLQKGIKELEVVRSIALKDKAATALNDLDKTLDVVQETVGKEHVVKEAVRNATVAFSLAVTKLQVLLESLEAEGYNTSEVSSKNKVKDCEKHLATFEDQLGRLDVLLREAEGSLDVLLREAELFQCVNEAKTALKIALKSLFGSKDVSKTENQEERPSLYETALNLSTLWHLVDAANLELEHATFIRSSVEEVIDATSIVDVIRLDEAVVWEQRAIKSLDEANKALKRLEDFYFGNM